ncbi:MAG TPA: peptide chain release factor N(5)-glutamine methyltransferase [Pyrinomonadaceae bacterium]|jgi:release factor glutamine methyltransferase|nr:peptide chain release factor N(5)-glutamine methyltransferase [Pyrinomonadaceae bacterium]
MNIARALDQATEILKTAAIQEPRREAISLLELAIGRGRTFIFAHPDDDLTRIEQDAYSAFVNRRAAREPLQYIRGHQEFYDLDFIVTPDVLIPRPETEILVENAIKELRSKNDATFCEVGIGSGCISVSVLHELPFAKAVGLDVSEKALEITKTNAERHRVSDRLTLVRSYVFDALTNQHFDMVVSNPPYVPCSDLETLQPEVRDFEPHVALTDGANGLSIIERIVSGAPQYLRPSGSLVMEIGFDQSEAVRGMFDIQIWERIEFLEDLQSIPRIVWARLS